MEYYRVLWVNYYNNIPTTVNKYKNKLKFNMQVAKTQSHLSDI